MTSLKTLPLVAAALVWGSLALSADYQTAVFTGFDDADEFNSFQYFHFTTPEPDDYDPTFLDLYVVDYGDPDGSYVEMISFIDPLEPSEGGSETGYRTENIAVYQDQFWIPAFDGPIESVYFSIDVRTGGEFANLYFGIEQDGSGTFIYPDFYDENDLYDGFTTITREIDLADYDFIDGFGSDIPILFGFGFAFETFDEFGGQAQIEFDNFLVEVKVIPEPSALALLGLGGFALVLLRRRRA